MAKKRKLSQKQLQALAKGRAMRKGFKKPKAKINTMAKRKTTRKSYKSSSKKKGMLSSVSGILGAVAYGAVRQRLSSAIANSAIGQKLPATEFTDEAVMLAMNFGARKIGLGKNPIGNSILKAQKTVELARVGQTVVDIYANKTSATNSNGTKNNGLIMLN